MMEDGGEKKSNKQIYQCSEAFLYLNNCSDLMDYVNSRPVKRQGPDAPPWVFHFSSNMWMDRAKILHSLWASFVQLLKKITSQVMSRSYGIIKGTASGRFSTKSCFRHLISLPLTGMETLCVIWVLGWPHLNLWHRILTFDGYPRWPTLADQILRNGGRIGGFESLICLNLMCD